ncbi:hypothetical protein FI667_g16811, partial [Globisporangium splendens]
MVEREWRVLTDEQALLLSPRRDRLQELPQPTARDEFRTQQPPWQCHLDEMSETSLDPFDELIRTLDDELPCDGDAVSLVHVDGTHGENSVHVAILPMGPAPKSIARCDSPTPRQVDPSASRSQELVITCSARAAAYRESNRKRTGRACGEPKAEIARLREEISQLETKLYAWREFWKRSHKTMEQQRAIGMYLNTWTAASAASSGAFQWKEVAARQREELSASEAERERLRSQLQMHKKLTRAIQRLIKKREESMASLPEDFRPPFQVNPHFVLPGCTSELEELLATNKAMSTSVRKIHELITSRSAGRAAFRAWAVKQEIEDGMFVEFADCNVAPFDRKLICNTLQSFSIKQANDLDVQEYFRNAEDTCLQQFVAGKPSHSVRIREASRCIHSEAFSAFIITRAIHPLDRSGKPLARLLERRWIIVSGNTHGSGDTDSGFCENAAVIQSYFMMRPEVANNGSDGSWNRHALEQATIPTLDGVFTAAAGMFLTALVNEGAKKNRYGPWPKP